MTEFAVLLHSQRSINRGSLQISKVTKLTLNRSGEIARDYRSHRTRYILRRKINLFFLHGEWLFAAVNSSVCYNYRGFRYNYQ